jgi:hypothetical protein
MTPEQLARRATHARARAFLAAYKRTGSITAAAVAASIDRTTHYAWLRSATYREAFERAAEQAAGVLEDEAIERATRGVFEPLVWQGQFSNDEEGKPYGVWKKSDGLLQFLLRGALPAKYRSTGALEISGPQGGPIPLEQKRLATLTDDELAALIAVAQKLTASASDGSGTDAPGA